MYCEHEDLDGYPPFVIMTRQYLTEQFPEMNLNSALDVPARMQNYTTISCGQTLTFRLFLLFHEDLNHEEMYDYLRFLNESHQYFKDKRVEANSSQEYAYVDMILTTGPFIRRAQI